MGGVSCSGCYNHLAIGIRLECIGTIVTGGNICITVVIVIEGKGGLCRYIQYPILVGSGTTHLGGSTVSEY